MPSKTLFATEPFSFTPNANELFHDYMKRMPADWDIIHFYSSRPIGDDPNDKMREFVTKGIYRGFNEGGGTVCLGIRRRCLEYLLSIATPIKCAIDGRTNWPTLNRETGLNGYIVSPLPCGISDFGSEIETRGTRWVYREKRTSFSSMVRLFKKLTSYCGKS